MHSQWYKLKSAGYNNERQVHKEKEEDKMKEDKKNMWKSKMVKKSDGFVDDDVKSVHARDRCRKTDIIPEDKQTAEENLRMCL